MKYYLTQEERVSLVSQHKKERDKPICDRIKVILAYDDGCTYTEIARRIVVDDETARRYVREYFEEKKLNPMNGGSVSFLTPEQTDLLNIHLREKTYQKVKDICFYVKKTFNIKYSVSGMTKWLKANGFRYKKPKKVPEKVDEAKQEEFVAHYESLKSSLKSGETIYFVDSTHPQYQTYETYGWIAKGEYKAIATTSYQKRVNIMGALTLDGHRVETRQVEQVNSDELIQLCMTLRKNHLPNKKIHLILDNAAYHKSKRVKEEAERLNIELHYLPPYSPNLNLIERLWKLMHEHVHYNKFYPSFSEFKNAINYFFRHISKKKKLLRDRMTDRFQILQTPNFAS